MSETLSMFKLLRLVRDARSTKNSDRLLLNALAMRSDPKRNYACWPSYRQLGLDTMLDEVTLKRAAKRLEDAGLLRRRVRKNRSNLFFVNVTKLIEQAEAMREANRKSKSENWESPFEFSLEETNESHLEDDDSYYGGEYE